MAQRQKRLQRRACVLKTLPIAGKWQGLKGGKCRSKSLRCDQVRRWRIGAAELALELGLDCFRRQLGERRPETVQAINPTVGGALPETLCPANDRLYELPGTDRRRMLTGTPPNRDP